MATKTARPRRSGAEFLTTCEKGQVNGENRPRFAVGRAFFADDEKSRSGCGRLFNFCSMMKKIVFLALLLAAFAAPSRAQVPIIDSLQAVLRGIPVNDDTAQIRHRAKIFFKISSEYWSQLKDFEKSRDHARQALVLYDRLNHARAVGNCLRTVAFCHSEQGHFAEAIDTFLLSYRIWEQLRDTSKMSLVLSLVADLYLNPLGNKEKAKQYAQQCFELNALAKNPHGLCACGVLLGSAYSETGRFDSARLQLQRTMELVKVYGNGTEFPNLYQSMARLERGQKNYAAEREWLLKVEAAYRDHPEAAFLGSDANYLLELFRCFLNLNDLPAARRYQKLALESLAGIQSHSSYANYFENMSLLAERENRPADALFYYKKHIEARDSVNNLDETRRITQIQMTHDFEKKQAVQAAAQANELALRDARTDRQRLLFGLILLGLLGGGAFWFYANRQKQNRQRTELELANLRAQINPHFIFNCLNSIYRYTKERDTDTASKYLQKFSSLLRLVLENSRSEKITLGRDLEALQQYADIESLRFKEKLRFSIDLDPEIDPTFLEIPGMLIQPHVENAIWHGLMHREGGGEIVVRLRQSAENRLRVEIEDNGIGRAAATELESKSALAKKSLGQKITDQRLRAAGKLAHSETIDLFDADGKAAGTRIVLEIPL